jgi:HEPN domain-containing protein
MANRYRDWFRQAEADLKHAKNALGSGDYEWCCFAAQQAGEKAIKAVFLKNGMDAWGHTITTLLGNLSTSSPIKENLLECAKALDKHYIPTRYPNGFDSGAPSDYYTKREGEHAIECAHKILTFCENQIR